MTLRKTFLILLLFGSCTIQGNLKGLVSNLKNMEPQMIVEYSNCSSLDYQQGKVLKVNGTNILECIEKWDRLIIYLWQPDCQSKNCISPNLLQNLCNKNGYELLTVAEYYDPLHIKANYSLNNIILGIDVDHYNTVLTKKYVFRFFKDLGISPKYSKNNIFFQLDNANLISSSPSIDSLSF